MITHAWRVMTLHGHPALLCLCCNRYSYHPDDITHHFCGGCGLFLDDLPRLYDPSTDPAPLPMDQPRRGTRLRETRIHHPLFTGTEEETR